MKERTGSPSSSTVQARNLPANTIRYYRFDLTALVQFLETQHIAALDAITPAAIRRYVAELEQSHNAGGVHGNFRSMRAFIRFLVADGNLSRHPLTNDKAPKNPLTVLEPV